MTFSRSPLPDFLSFVSVAVNSESSPRLTHGNRILLFVASGLELPSVLVSVTTAYS